MDDYSNKALKQAIRNTLSDGRPPSRLSLDVVLTDFQKMVYEAIQTIAFGSTRTYGEVAEMAGRPKGARAVGQALGRNPLPLIFP